MPVSLKPKSTKKETSFLLMCINLAMKLLNLLIQKQALEQMLISGTSAANSHGNEHYLKP